MEEHESGSGEEKEVEILATLPERKLCIASLSPEYSEFESKSTICSASSKTGINKSAVNPQSVNLDTICNVVECEDKFDASVIGQCSRNKTDSNDSPESNLSSCPSKELQSPFQPSKKRLRNTKRRAGALYKQIKNSKLCSVKSKYFNQAHNNQKRWIPPRSPYALVQEDLFDNPWQLLVATIFLTKTAAKRALPQLHKFLARFPRPEDVLQAKYEDIDEFFKPLGLAATRSHTIMRFTVEYLEKNWTYPRELYGIGKYGDDSYRMFCINEWRQVTPDDIPLSLYRNWLLENSHQLGID